MAHYLVTGGAGFIGSNLAEALLEKGEKVRVIDNLSTGKIENLKPLLNDIEFIEGSICDLELCREVVRGVDFVLHHAAVGSVPQSVDQPLETTEVNIVGTVNLLLASVENKIERFVCASSSSVYGDSMDLPFRENSPIVPVSPYAVTKYAQELYCYTFFKVYGLPTVSLRYFNVYGPRQHPRSLYSNVVPAFACALLNGKSPRIFGDGTQSRDFVFVGDVVEANILACYVEDAKGKSFNIGYGKATTILELLGFMKEILQADIEPVFEPERPGDVSHTLADISLAEKVLGYTPKYDMASGLKVTLEWFKENKDELRF